jgi:hypothetical protein
MNAPSSGVVVDVLEIAGHAANELFRGITDAVNDCTIWGAVDPGIYDQDRFQTVVFSTNPALTASHGWAKTRSRTALRRFLRSRLSAQSGGSAGARP